METKEALAGNRLPGCWFKDCIGIGLWRVAFPVDKGILETTMIVCDTHRDSSLPFAEWIFGQPGLLEMLQRQLDREKSGTKLSRDMIPVFILAVVSVVTPCQPDGKNR